MWVKSSNLKFHSFFYSMGIAIISDSLNPDGKSPRQCDDWSMVLSGGPQSRAGEGNPRQWAEVGWQAFEHPSQLYHFTRGSGIYPLYIQQVYIY